MRKQGVLDLRDMGGYKCAKTWKNKICEYMGGYRCVMIWEVLDV